MGGIGPVGHRPAPVDGGRELDLDLALADPRPGVRADRLADEALRAHPPDVLLRGEDGHAREEPQRREIRMVEVQVGQQDRVRAGPGLPSRSVATPAQDPRVPPQQRIGHEPDAVEVEYDGRVAEPRDIEVQEGAPSTKGERSARSVPIASPRAGQAVRPRLGTVSA